MAVACWHTQTAKFFREKISNGIYIYLTHSYTQTQYQVVEYFSLPFTVLGAQRQDTLKHPCVSAGSHSLTKEILLTVGQAWWTISGPRKVLYSSSTQDSN